MIATPTFWRSTRGRLVTLLRPAEQTVSELARQLGLTDNAVRAHLLTLQRDGLVHQAGQRPAARRPNYLYALTPQAEQLFPKAYAPVLRQLFHLLPRSLSPRTHRRLLRETGRRLADPHLPELARLPFPQRLQRVAEILQSMGASIHLTHADHHIRLQGASCPLAELVHDPHNPSACLIMQAMLTHLLGVPATEQCHRGPSPHCCFTLRAPNQ